MTETPDRTRPATYGERYSRRLLPTVAVFVALAVVAGITSGRGATLGSLAIAIIFWAIVASALNLVVAAFPGHTKVEDPQL